ncbi:peroxiredoxin-like 2C [Lepisosteus oculatus]|uniref:peroxiredoxin-like 2C n=1 Tax=Lepisosteus oculatus TaxID=7918 RepID=UPI0037138BAF
MAADLPVTQQIARAQQGHQKNPVNIPISEVEDCFVYNRHGKRIPFKSLYDDKKSIVIFVRHFLCYTCKEYVEDLAKIPKRFLTDADVRLIVIGQSSHHHIEAFCALTGYPHEIYVDPERQIYKKLGMKKGEVFTESAAPCPHVKSSTLMGSLKSLWRAMNSPAFDFQGDLNQQGGCLILGPGSEVHFTHFDMNRLDHMPITWLLQLTGVQMVDFRDQPRILDV